MSVGPAAAVTSVATAVVLAAFAVAPGPSTRLPASTLTNHRGRRLRTSLGWAVLAAVPAFLAGEIVARTADHAPVGWWWVAAVAGGSVVVSAAGAWDDRQPDRVHGLRTHLGALAGRRVTSGIVKLVAAVAAALAVALAARTSAARVLLGVAVMAGTSNAFNLLDVAPGRALKFGLLSTGALLAARRDALVWSVAGMATQALWPDLAERAMLGDQGSMLLGYLIGVAVFERLSAPGLAAALAAVLVIHAFAETVTLSRIIGQAPPLRWFDRLGRLPAPSGAPGDAASDAAGTDEDGSTGS